MTEDPRDACLMCSDERVAGPCFGPGRCFAATPCEHRDERGSTVMEATPGRYECIVCGERFRLVPVER